MSLPNFPSFSEFVKHPFAFVLYASFIVIGYLYFQNSKSAEQQIAAAEKEKRELRERIYVLEEKVDKLYMILSGIDGVEIDR